MLNKMYLFIFIYIYLLSTSFGNLLGKVMEVISRLGNIISAFKDLNDTLMEETKKHISGHGIYLLPKKKIFNFLEYSILRPSLSGGKHLILE